MNIVDQGSVLSPVLFNVYTSDIMNTTSWKFMYADDVGLVTQAESFEKLEEILNEDLSIVQTYFKSWHLTLNPNKTTSIAFHLNNRESDRKLNLMAQGVYIQGEDAPKYLGIKLDRTLTFKQHLEGVKNKLKTRNNIISKLAGTNWRCRANVLRTSALALVYSAGEYCAPV
ncbi:Reverse transcriptase domain [Cinara cedri]|uniref:Reverse transcriptase domain n=1 Tax=Cinara cedri TaxID=506608 RepID=A0A5E4NJU7_9HEMI|nr:Reverse transcriptase domain [Cinara cedri]